MFVSSGLLLWLFFQSAQGEMIQCFVGGIINDNAENDNIKKTQQKYCDELEKESVLQKYYINQFGILMSNRKKEWNKILNVEIDTDNTDIPIIYRFYNIFNTYSEITKKSYSKPNLFKRLSISGFSKIKKEDEVYKNYSLKVLFIGKNIVEYWNDDMHSATDIHRLKFHSKLVTMYKENYQFSKEESMVFLKSSYSAVGIYYLTNNYLIAQCTAKDSLNFFILMKSILYNKQQDTDEMEVIMLEILTYTAYIEMFDFEEAIDYDKVHLKHMLTERQDKLNKLILAENHYPCSYLFKYRSVLLDKNQNHLTNNDPWNFYAGLIYNGSIYNCENYSDSNKMQVYLDIISSVYDPEFERIKGFTSFICLINALKVHVFTSEDRLLNYKATMLAMKKISNCVNSNGWINEVDDILCNTLAMNREIDQELNYILDKLIQMQIYQITDVNFIPIYGNVSGLFDENKIHLVVATATDHIDLNLDLSLRRINMVNTNITHLNRYIKDLQNVDTNFAKQRLMKAYKWLAELQGVLCTNSTKNSEVTTYQKNLELALTQAIKLQRTHKFDDDHLDFLYYKKICKDSYSSYSWERYYNADGWVQKIPISSEKRMNDPFYGEGHECDGVSKFQYIDNPFIHKAEVNILMFKQLMMKNENNNSAINYLQNALSHLVITSEDRVRNLQAHELHSMHFIWRNYTTVKYNENH